MTMMKRRKMINFLINKAATVSKVLCCREKHALTKTECKTHKYDLIKAVQIASRTHTSRSCHRSRIKRRKISLSV